MFVWRTLLRNVAWSSEKTATVPPRSHCREETLHRRPSTFTPSPRRNRLWNERYRPLPGGSCLFDQL